MSNLKTINEIVKKWKLNQTLLAEKIGVPKTTFVKSLNGQQYYKFTDEQFNKLKTILIELCTDMETVITEGDEDKIVADGIIDLIKKRPIVATYKRIRELKEDSETDGAEKAIKDFKSALKRDIEKRIEDINQYDMIHHSYKAKMIKECKIFLSLIDKTEP